MCFYLQYNRLFKHCNSSFQDEPVSSEPSETIVSAVDRLTSDEDLIADGSRVYSLPTIPGKHKDLKTISPDTVCYIFVYTIKPEG